MSTDDQRAEASLSALVGLACDYGGLIDSTGHCSYGGHAHCPFCGELLECQHEVTRWDDVYGYRGPEFPTTPPPDSPMWNMPDAEVRTLLADLAPLWDVYVEDADAAYVTNRDLVAASIELLALPVVSVGWWQGETPGGGVGDSYFARRPREVSGRA